MKKKYVYFIIVLIFLFLLWCYYNYNSSTVKNGDYYMEVETKSAVSPYITIDGGRISFVYDLLSNYSTSGNYSIDGDILTMTTDDSNEIYVFQIHGNNLIFQKSRSSQIKLKDEEHGFKIKDKAKFHLKR